MTKLEKMDEFLKYYAKVYKQNPNLSINKSTIYSGLANYGLNEDEKHKGIDNLFNEWLNYYSNKKLNVFYSERQPGFLQFHNSTLNNPNHVKLYLSFGKDDMEECVKIIFDYIDKMNFETYSKVARTLRSDSVVLRMTNIEEAKQLINFINNNEYLKSKAKEVNPFTIHNGVVGMAFDKYLSYNSIMAYTISEYFKNVNDFDKVNIDDFKRYVIDLYNSIFVDKSKLEKFKNSSIFQENERRFNSNNSEIVNFYQIFRTMFLSLNDKTELDDYFNLISECQDERVSKGLMTHFDKYDKKVNDDKTKQDKEKLLREFIIYASKKYGNKNVLLILQDYINGNVNAITRDNGFRELFRTNLLRKDILDITLNNLEGYIQNTLQPKDEMIYCFEGAINTTYKKYGFKQTCAALEGIFNNNFSYISNGNQKYRQRLKEFDFDSLIREINSYLSTIEITDDDYIKELVSHIVGIEKEVNL